MMLKVVVHRWIGATVLECEPWTKPAHPSWREAHPTVVQNMWSRFRVECLVWSFCCDASKGATSAAGGVLFCWVRFCGMGRLPAHPRQRADHVLRNPHVRVRWPQEPVES